jgi:hypothetical protein
MFNASGSASESWLEVSAILNNGDGGEGFVEVCV